jgi:hypothetical protein
VVIEPPSPTGHCENRMRRVARSCVAPTHCWACLGEGGAVHRHKGVAPGAEPAHSSRRRTPDMLKLSKLPLPAACGPSLGGSSQSITTPRRSGGLPLLRPMVTVGTSWGGCLEIHSGIYPELPWMGWHHRHLHPRRPGS